MALTSMAYAPEPKVAEREPDMLQLDNRISNSLTRLREMNDALTARLDRFKPEPTNLVGDAGGRPDAAPPPPVSGTAASLHNLTGLMHDQLNRLDGLVSRVQAIL